MALLEFYVNILINTIINQEFNTSKCLLIFSEKSSDFDINYNGNLPFVKINIINNKITSNSVFKHYFGCEGIIIQNEDPTNIFDEFERQIRLNKPRYNNRKFLLVSGINSSKITERRFFNSMSLNYVADMLLLIPEMENTEELIFNLKTHKYGGLSDDRAPILIDKWFAKNQSFLYGFNFYPDKLNNQLGRPFKMATFQYEPYSIIADSIENFHGSELLSATQFGLKYNMTPIPIVNDYDDWGKIFPNWSGNGLLGNLAEDKADIGFAALYTWEYCYEYLDLSKPLVRTGITCLVPAPKLAGGWLTPLFSYTTQLWIAVAVTFLLGTVVLALYSYYYESNSSIIENSTTGNKLKIILVIFEQSTQRFGKPLLLQPLTKKELPRQSNTTLIMTMMLILSLFLTSSYSSGLSSVMTVPRYENPINTVKEFARSGLYWGATQDAWITSIQNTNEEDYVEIVRRFTPTSNENLRQHSKTGQFAFSIERLPFENFAIGSYIEEDIIESLHLMQQDFYWEQCVIMTRKNSVLLPMLDMFILRIFEAGLISKWQNEAVSLYMDSYVQKAVKNYNQRFKEHKVVKLKWTHVEGAFGILAIGYTSSLIILIIEILFYKKK